MGEHRPNSMQNNHMVHVLTRVIPHYPGRPLQWLAYSWEETAALIECLAKLPFEGFGRKFPVSAYPRVHENIV